MKQAKISVIIPVFNSYKYLPSTLDSVLCQTFSSFEVICVDDGSTDNSFDILNEYKNKDDRIKIIRQNNQGVVAARNNAIKKAVGEYIFTLDSDDLISPNLLKYAFEAISSGKGDIITFRVFMFGEKINKEMCLLYPSKINMAYGNCLVNAALFRKSLYEKSCGFDPSFNKGLEDYDFYLNLIYRHNARVYRIPKVLFYYRIKSSKESRNAIQNELYNNELMEKINLKYPEIKKNRSPFYSLIYLIKKCCCKCIIMARRPFTSYPKIG